MQLLDSFNVAECYFARYIAHFVSSAWLAATKLTLKCKKWKDLEGVVSVPMSLLMLSLLMLYTIGEVLVQEEEEQGKKSNSFEELSGELHSQMKASHSHNIVVGVVFWVLHAKVEL